MVRNAVLGFVALVGVLVIFNNPQIITDPFYKTLDTIQNPSKYEDNSPLNKLMPEPGKIERDRSKTKAKPNERPGGFGAGAVAIQRAQGL